MSFESSRNISKKTHLNRSLQTSSNIKIDDKLSRLLLLQCELILHDRCDCDLNHNKQGYTSLETGLPVVKEFMLNYKN